MATTGITLQLELRIEDLREEEDGFAKGRATLLGGEFHFEAVRVRDDEDGEQVADCAPGAADGGLAVLCLDALQVLVPGRFGTVEIPGMGGGWVVYLVPPRATARSQPALGSRRMNPYRRPPSR